MRTAPQNAASQALRDCTLVFMHVPATKGAALRRILFSVYGSDACHWIMPSGKPRFDSIAALKAMSGPEKRNLRVVTGHFPYGMLDRIMPHPTLHVTVLRDPVDRIRSQYQIVRERPEHPHYEIARAGLASYACAASPSLDNLQTRMLAGGLECGNGPLDRTVDEADLERASEHLSRFAGVGVHERFADAVDVMGRLLRWRELPMLESVDVEGEPVEVDEETRSLVAERNRFDAVLHGQARARQEVLAKLAEEHGVPLSGARSRLRSRPVAAPIAAEVRDVSKVFRIPTNRAATLKQRVLHPLQRQDYRILRALEGVSFDVQRGEFFGIVGRNGSGKSTLLKLIASIYRADTGTIRVAGRMAPFIELGVGFNPELSAYDNVVLNGVMMGLTPREARRRFDEVIEFAELEEFTELKLRNYSSGMRVRLAFAVMVQVDADVMLIDEVLAVGDASFQERCAETFTRLIERGKTVLLVTHSMDNIRRYCHRALLLEGGKIDVIGDPSEVAARYTEVNFAQHKQHPGLRTPGQGHGLPIEVSRVGRITDAWIQDSHQRRTHSLARRESIELRATIELEEDVADAGFALEIWRAGGARVFAPFASPLGRECRAGDRLVVTVTIENRLTPGRYRLNCGLSRRDPVRGEVPTSPVHGVSFEVSGDRIPGSLTDFAHELRVEPHVETQVMQA